MCSPTPLSNSPFSSEKTWYLSSSSIRLSKSVYLNRQKRLLFTPPRASQLGSLVPFADKPGNAPNVLPASDGMKYTPGLPIEENPPCGLVAKVTCEKSRSRRLNSLRFSYPTEVTQSNSPISVPKIAPSSWFPSLSCIPC